MNFATMTDGEIRRYAAAICAAATNTPTDWYEFSAALSALNGKVGLLRNANYGAVDFDPIAPIDREAEARLLAAQSCFRWGY